MLDSLYQNIGGKIKNWAKWIFIVEAIGSIITAIALPIVSGDPDDVILISLLIAIFGPIVAWVSSWFLYAFGELVEDVHAIRNKDNMQEIKVQYTQQDTHKKEPTNKAKKYTADGILPKYEGNGYVCPSCNMAMDYIAPCERCGYTPPQSN